jgi:hypothetical protein
MKYGDCSIKDFRNLTATICAAFGIDPAQTVLDTLGRPHVLSEGNVVPGLFA